MEEGDKFPEFELISHNGEIIKLSDFEGKKFVLFSYPRALTPGCTNEVCSLRDYFNELKDREVTPLGISNDPPKKNNKFAEKHNLQYNLLSDESNELLTKLGAYGEKKIYGNLRKGTFRYTWVVDDNGVIRKIFKKVKTKIHGEEILNALDELNM